MKILFICSILIVVATNINHEISFIGEQRDDYLISQSSRTNGSTLRFARSSSPSRWYDSCVDSSEVKEW